MVIATKALGSIEVSQDDVIRFPHGLYGFEDATRFVLLRHGARPDSPFMWLQCVDGREPCFPVADPGSLLKDYRPVFSAKTLEDLGLASPEDLRTLVVATVPHDVKKMYFNLRSPIVINVREKVALQSILESDAYPVRYYFFEEREGR